MKRTGRIGLAGMSLVLFGGLVSPCLGDVKVIVKPWWPRAIVVAPRHPPPPVPEPLPPRPRPAPDRPPAGAVGYVAVDVRPARAAVYTDGAFRGRAYQFDGIEDYLVLAAGRHQISLRLDGYRKESFDVLIKPDRILQLEVTLERPVEDETDSASAYRLDLEKTGSLILKVNPADASVYIDDEYYGPASTFCEEEGAIVLRAGSHALAIVRPGYAPHSQTLELSSDRLREIHIKLEKAD